MPYISCYHELTSLSKTKIDGMLIYPSTTVLLHIVARKQSPLTVGLLLLLLLSLGRPQR
jgi:hypothetical protein